MAQDYERGCAISVITNKNLPFQYSHGDYFSVLVTLWVSKSQQSCTWQTGHNARIHWLSPLRDVLHLSCFGSTKCTYCSHERGLQRSRGKSSSDFIRIHSRVGLNSTLFLSIFLSTPLLNTPLETLLNVFPICSLFFSSSFLLLNIFLVLVVLILPCTSQHD